MNLIEELKQTPNNIMSRGEISIRVLSANSEKSIFIQDVANITAWRNLFSDAYLTHFFSTMSRTYNWLVDSYMRSDSDLMLMFDDKYGVCFGHIAFINFNSVDGVSCCELSRVARAPGLGGPQGMKSAFALALRWCGNALGVDEIRLEVFADNVPAVKFYKYFGFIEYGQKSLRKVSDNSDYKWEVCDVKNQERRLLLMKKVLSVN